MNYFLKQKSKIYGPYSRKQLIALLKAKKISSKTLVGNSADGPFQPLKDVWSDIKNAKRKSSESDVNVVPVEVKTKSDSKNSKRAKRSSPKRQETGTTSDRSISDHAVTPKRKSRVVLRWLLIAALSGVAIVSLIAASFIWLPSGGGSSQNDADNKFGDNELADQKVFEIASSYAEQVHLLTLLDQQSDDLKQQWDKRRTAVFREWESGGIMLSTEPNRLADDQAPSRFLKQWSDALQQEYLELDHLGNRSLHVGLKLYATRQLAEHDFLDSYVECLRQVQQGQEQYAAERTLVDSIKKKRSKHHEILVYFRSISQKPKKERQQDLDSYINSLNPAVDTTNVMRDKELQNWARNRPLDSWRLDSEIKKNREAHAHDLSRETKLNERRKQLGELNEQEVKLRMQLVESLTKNMDNNREVYQELVQIANAIMSTRTKREETQAAISDHGQRFKAALTKRRDELSQKTKKLTPLQQKRQDLTPVRMMTYLVKNEVYTGEWLEDCVSVSIPAKYHPLFIRDTRHPNPNIRVIEGRFRLKGDGHAMVPGELGGVIRGLEFEVDEEYCELLIEEKEAPSNSEKKLDPIQFYNRLLSSLSSWRDLPTIQRLGIDLDQKDRLVASYQSALDSGIARANEQFQKDQVAEVKPKDLFAGLKIENPFSIDGPRHKLHEEELAEANATGDSTQVPLNLENDTDSNGPNSEQGSNASNSELVGLYQFYHKGTATPDPGWRTFTANEQELDGLKKGDYWNRGGTCKGYGTTEPSEETVKLWRFLNSNLNHYFLDEPSNSSKNREYLLAEVWKKPIPGKDMHEVFVMQDKGGHMQLLTDVERQSTLKNNSSKWKVKFKFYLIRKKPQ